MITDTEWKCRACGNVGINEIYTDHLGVTEITCKCGHNELYEKVRVFREAELPQ